MAVARTSKTNRARAAAQAMVGAFQDSCAPPTDRELAAALGVVHPLWIRFISTVRISRGPLVADEWSFSKTFGWTLRLKQPRRALVHLTPCESGFLASFALGEKACLAARDAEIPAAMLAIIDAAPRYSEGRGVRIPVRTVRDLEGVLRLAEIKASTTK
jgi:uncharacterized protein DUF3788